MTDGRWAWWLGGGLALLWAAGGAALALGVPAAWVVGLGAGASVGCVAWAARRSDTAGRAESRAVDARWNAADQDRTQALSQRDRLAALLEGASEAVIAVDASHRVFLVNAAARALLHIPERPTGRPLVEVVRLPAAHALLSPDAPPTGTAELILDGPPRRILRARVSPGASGGDRLLVLQDVTTLRKLEVMRQDFVANVSHELRTPVAVIRANAETLLDGALDDARVAGTFVEAMHRNAERLSRLLSDLLDLSRIEAGSYPLDVRAVAVAPVAARVVEQLDAAEPGASQRVSVQVAPGLEVLADPGALDQILSNYIENALKYAPPSGQVVVSAALEADRVRISVADDGPGIAAVHHARLFERFYRVDSGRSKAVGGTGLGLAIVKHLAAGMGGEVGMAPRKPHGSVFWVRLPAAAS